MAVYIAIARKTGSGKPVFAKPEQEIEPLRKSGITTLICRDDVEKLDIYEVTITGFEPIDTVERCAETGFFACVTCQRMTHQHCTRCGKVCCKTHNKPDPRLLGFGHFLCESCFEEVKAEMASKK